MIIIIDTDHDEKRRLEMRKQEMASLVSTMGSDIVYSTIINLSSIIPSTLIGKGKIERLIEDIEIYGIDCIIFDCDVSPRQQRNLEEALDCAVIDRQEVILQIFSNRATTKEANLQVELARALYSLPRLKRKWTHLSRQQGGMKGTRGEGEKQLEIDKRIISNNIAKIKKELEKIERQRLEQRKNRDSSIYPTVAIVGYTNAGKSSLLNALSKGDTLVEDKLFATLDSLTRKVNLPHGTQILLTDTVGFVKDLPHHLVESFKSTLEEVKYADLIIHLLDASHPDMWECYETTKEVLYSLGCSEQNTIYVINKIDAIENQFLYNRLVHELSSPIEISVRDHIGFEHLAQGIEEALHATYQQKSLFIPYHRGELVAALQKRGSILSIDYEDKGVRIEAKIPPQIMHMMTPFSIIQ
jgi:GTP-binding protein HflX